MGFEPDSLPTSTPKLPLLSLPRQPAEPPGMLTPPLRTAGASVPFIWEEAPGKPRSFLTEPTPTATRSLDLPPRLQSADLKTPSPTTVLDGPYVVRSASSTCQRSAKDAGSPGRKKGVLGKAKNGSREMEGGGKAWLVRSSSSRVCIGGDLGEKEAEEGRGLKRSGTFLNITNSTAHFWATIFGNFRRPPSHGKRENRT